MSPEFLYAALTVGSAVFALWCLWSLCWGVVPFTAKAKARKERKTVLNAARTFLLSYEDLPAYRDGGECGARMGNLRDALARKDVLAKLYGGDVTREMTVLEKQKRGRARMKEFGHVNVPQSAFIAVLKGTVKEN